MRKTDTQLKQSVEEELLWNPMVNAAQIGVTVTQGAVTLLGSVSTFAEKWAAEDAVKNLQGVRTVAQDLSVTLAGEHVRTDTEIAQAVQHALSWNVFIPKTITAAVKSGHVTLEGEAAWNFQRSAAEKAVSFLPGVLYVSNDVRLTTKASAVKVKEQVLAALQRQASDDAGAVEVTTCNDEITLSGKVPSWRVSEKVTGAAWAAPGVRRVIDNMQVSIG